jgi:hypothetical protein
MKAGRFGRINIAASRRRMYGIRAEPISALGSVQSKEEETAARVLRAWPFCPFWCRAIAVIR